MIITTWIYQNTLNLIQKAYHFISNSILEWKCPKHIRVQSTWIISFLPTENWFTEYEWIMRDSGGEKSIYFRHVKFFLEMGWSVRHARDFKACSKRAIHNNVCLTFEFNLCLLKTSSKHFIWFTFSKNYLWCKN